MISKESTTAKEMLRELQELQRRGLSKCDLQVHVERMRAVNDVTEKSHSFEEIALLALDIITGGSPECRMEWPAQPPARPPLKPCEHCGGEAALVVVDREYIDLPNGRTRAQCRWGVVCTVCPCQTNTESDPKKAAAEWNDQPYADSLRAQVATRDARIAELNQLVSNCRSCSGSDWPLRELKSLEDANPTCCTCKMSQDYVEDGGGRMNRIHLEDGTVEYCCEGCIPF